MLNSATGVFVMTRWKYAVTVVSSFKYLNAYSHYCAFGSKPNSLSSTNCNSVSDIKVPSLLPSLLYQKSDKQCSVIKEQSLKLENLNCYLPALHHQQVHYNKFLYDIGNRYQPCLLSCSSKQKNVPEKLKKSNENTFVPSTHIICWEPLSHFSINTNVLHTEKLHHNEDFRTHPNNSASNEPADDPSQKIRILKEKILTEAPMLFNQAEPYHDFAMYTSNVDLYVALKKRRYSSSGLPKYKFAVSIFRRFYMWYLRKPDLEIINIFADEEKNVIHVRWRVAGWTPWSLISFYVFRMPENQSYFDFSSILYVNKGGLVWRHDVTKVRHISDKTPFAEKVQHLRQQIAGTAVAVSSRLPHCFNNNVSKCSLNSKQIN